MLRSLKIFLIILGLGVFTLPKQLVFAQKVENCSEKSEKKDCCKKESSKSCHSDDPSKNTDSDCGNDCSKCHTCSVNIFLNYISPDNSASLQKPVFAENLRFSYKISFFFSSIQNIWQPPKLG